MRATRPFLYYRFRLTSFRFCYDIHFPGSRQEGAGRQGVGQKVL